MLRSRPLSGLRARRIEQIKRLEDKTAPTIAKCNGCQETRRTHEGPETACSYERPRLRDYYRRLLLGRTRRLHSTYLFQTMAYCLMRPLLPGTRMHGCYAACPQVYAPKPRRTGLLPRHWGRYYHVRNSRGRYSDSSMCGRMEGRERVVSGHLCD